MTIEDYLSTKDTAEILGVTSSRVRQLLRAGELDGHRMSSGIWFIDKEEVSQYQLTRRKAGRPRKEEDASTI